MDATIKFLMTYPCYVPMRREGHPYTVTTDRHEVAIVVCTDDDMLMRFFNGIAKTDEFDRFTINDSHHLSILLSEWRGRLWKQGPLTHLVLDPTPDTTAFHVYPIAQFLEQELQ